MAARMIPSIDPVTIEDLGERAVYIALRDQLPDGWVVRHNYTFTYWAGPKLGDGEADFIVMAPGLGLMVLEAKQSYSFTSVDGQWYTVDRRGGRTKTKNPFDQAQANKHKIVEKIICPRLGISKEQFGAFATYGHGVVFPFGRLKGPIPASQAPQVFFMQADMGSLRERIERSFVEWGLYMRPRGGETFGADKLQKVATILEGNAEIVEVAANEVDSEESAIEGLTRQQFDTFRNMMARPRVIVEGRAGSGKTMLAVWVAQTLASIGDKVLILCYNRLLARWIERNYDLPEEGVTVRNYHALCSDYAKRAGIAFSPPAFPKEAKTKFWEQDSPNILDKAVSSLGEDHKFDAIIVDEAQDFQDIWFIPVERLIRKPASGHFFIFHDPDQSIYLGSNTDERAWPPGMTTYLLEKNCRNTKCIARYCGEVISKPIESFERSPIGVPPMVVTAVQEPSHRAARVQQIVNAWLHEGFRPSQIAILSPWSNGNSSSVLGHLASINNIPVRGTDSDLIAWVADECIWASTIKAFKGLEATCVLVADVPAINTPGFPESDMYVAATRAKSRLVFLPSGAEAKAQVEKWIGANA